MESDIFELTKSKVHEDFGEITRGIPGDPSCDFPEGTGDPSSQEEAIQWLERNLDSINPNTSQTPYSREDFIQDAYYAAITAYNIYQEKKSEGKILGYEQCFRMTLSGLIRKLRSTSVPYSHIEDNNSTNRKAAGGHIDLQNLISPADAAAKQAQRAALIKKALKVMTPTQRKVWTLMINENLSLRDIGKVLGKDYRVVYKISQAGLRQVSRVIGNLQDAFLDYTPPE